METVVIIILLVIALWYRDQYLKYKRMCEVLGKKAVAWQKKGNPLLPAQ